MSDIDTGEVDSLKALDPDGRLEKIDEKANPSLGPGAMSSIALQLVRR